MFSIRGILFIVLLVTSIILTFRKPYIGILIYIVIEFSKEVLIDQLGLEFYGSLHAARVIAIITLVASFIKNDNDTNEQSNRIFYNPHNFILIAFVIITLVSSLFNTHKAGLNDVVIDLVKIVIFYFLLLKLINTPEKLKNTIWTIVLVTSIIGLVAYRKYENGEVSFAMPTIDMDKNDFATYLVMAIPLIYGLFFIETSKIKRGILCLSFLGLLLTILKTFSRGGFIGLGGVLLLILFLREKRIFKIVIAIPLTALYLWERAG